MREIIMTNGDIVHVDDEDFDGFSGLTWTAVFFHGRSVPYASVKIKQVRFFMHRLLLNAPRGMVVDHIDGNPLNNTKANLRLCTTAQNTRNSKLSKRNTSGFKGVSWHKHDKKWIARVKINRKYIYVGRFDDPKKAHEAYVEAAKQYHGEFANFGDGRVNTAPRAKEE